VQFPFIQQFIEEPFTQYSSIFGCQLEGSGRSLQLDWKGIRSRAAVNRGA